MKNMKKELLLTSIILLSLLLSGCTQPFSTTNYQTFHSNNINIPDIMNETLPQEKIEEFIEYGKALNFTLEYPENWKSEYNIDGGELFSIIFYPKGTETVQSKSIVIDLVHIYTRNITIEELKTDFRNPYGTSSEEDFSINQNIDVWKIISGPQEESQGTAYILYKPENEVYRIVIRFDDSDSNNIEIFEHMVKSFNR
jgi:hypothetical protein